MDLSSILVAQAVRSSLKASSKKRLLQELSAFMASVYKLDEATIFRSFQDRELLGPTGMGFGVAIPHGRIADLDRVVGAFVKLDSPVQFDAADGQPVDLVFALLAPEASNAEHLKALARISRALRDPQICHKLRSTTDPRVQYEILLEEQSSKAA